MQNTPLRLELDQQASMAISPAAIADAAAEPEASQEILGSIALLKARFEDAAAGCSSLLVLRVENAPERHDVAARLSDQFEIMRQLQLVCGRTTRIAPIGDNEFAILLTGINQCTDLIPRLEAMLSRAAAGHLNGDGRQLDCRIGVARSPIDAYDLKDLISMASAAARELSRASLGYQFICKRHKQH